MSKLETYISEAQLQARIAELASEIRKDLMGEPVLLVIVLKGSFIFGSDLLRALDCDARVDFVQVSSYGDQTTSSGIIQIKKDLDKNPEGQNVIIVEDIVDTGLTLSHLKELLTLRKPKTLRVVSLLSKPDARTHETLIDYVGFEIPNEFVVGYGLDYAERYRNLPYIAVLRD